MATCKVAFLFRFRVGIGRYHPLLDLPHGPLHVNRLAAERARQLHALVAHLLKKSMFRFLDLRR